jgi:hypothetical protein
MRAPEQATIALFAINNPRPILQLRPRTHIALVNYGLASLRHEVIRLPKPILAALARIKDNKIIRELPGCQLNSISWTYNINVVQQTYC